MTIFNTPRLSPADVDAMNKALRTFGRVKYNGVLTDADILVPAVKDAAGNIIVPATGLAAYFGVTRGTVNRWLSPLGSTYRPCVRKNDDTIAPQRGPGAADRRVYCMSADYDGYAQYGNDPPDGINPATGTAYSNTNLLAVLRQRIFLCSAMAMAASGGFQRDPIFNGDPLIIRRSFPTIANCLDFFQEIWLGNQGPWIAIAWIQFTIELDILSDGRRRWVAFVVYNEQAVGEASDLLELAPKDERKTPTQLPNCP